jgi:hypothetical protein
LLGQLADTGLAAVSRDHLARLPEPERRAAAIEGLRHKSWRVRRTCAQLLDRVDLTPESVAALTRALDDEHPQVRRKAVHTLTCENCKPNGCAADVRPAFERAIGDPSSLVRSMVVHACTLHFFDRQWAIDLVAGVAGEHCSFLTGGHLPQPDLAPAGGSFRAPVERAAATLKTWRILFTDYRRPLKTFRSSFRAAIGLYFFKESLHNPRHGHEPLQALGSGALGELAHFP